MSVFAGSSGIVRVGPRGGVSVGRFATLGTGGGVAVDPGPFPAIASMIARYRADSAGNTVSTINQTFAPSDVDVGANEITLPDSINLAAPGVTITSCGGTQIWFDNTGGALPPPLVAGTPYIASRTATGKFRIYPLYTQDQWATVPGALPEDTAQYAQNYMQSVNPIVLTGQGSGTHRIYSEDLVQTMDDLSGNGFTVSVPTGAVSDRNRHIERRTIGGKPALWLRRVARSHKSNTYCDYGKVMQLSGNAALYNTYRALIAGKRIVAQTYVVTSRATDTQGVAKCQPTVVNTTTGLFTAPGETGSSHSLTTLIGTKLLNIPGGSVPAGFDTTTTYWFRSVSATTGTLHPTLADATANTNIIIPTTTGTAGFILYQPTIPADFERQRNLCEQLWPSNDTGNTLSPHVGPEQGIYAITSREVDFTVGTLGDTGTAGRTISALGDLAKIYVWVPAATVAATCQDTGLPLTSGFYWITKKPASANVFRLHRSLAGAQAGVGFAGNLTDCIKWTAQGSGYVRMEPALDTQTFVTGYSNTQNAAAAWRMPQEVEKTLTVVADYNDPAESFVVVYIYWDGVQVDKIVTAQAKGNTPASSSPGTSGFTLFNSFGIHVAWEGEVREVILDADADGSVLTPAAIAARHAWLKTSYGIA